MTTICHYFCIKKYIYKKLYVQTVAKYSKKTYLAEQYKKLSRGSISRVPFTTIYHYFCIKNEYFFNFKKSKFYQILVQNASNYTIYNFFLGGTYPEPPPSLAQHMALQHMQFDQTKKKVAPSPPPWKILHTPMHNLQKLLRCSLL